MYKVAHLSNSNRRYTPTDREGSGGTMSRLTDECTEDTSLSWAFKPKRDAQLTAIGRRFPFTTFTGNPAGAAESFGRTTYHVR